jgi:hypothetical protein
LLLANLAVGLWLTPHYGQSTDEEANILFARASLESYSHPESPYRDPAREDKGPFYLMVWLKAGEALGRAVPGWVFADGRHFVNFLAFQLALISIYALAIRFTRPAVALTGVLLFETQPVFFGHAFINQKDIPFMGFFAASVVLGIALVDRYINAIERTDLTTGQESWGVLREGWHSDRRRAVRAAAGGAALALAIPAARLLLDAPLQAALEGIIRAAYVGQSWGPVNELFARLAQNIANVAPEDYILRAVRLTNLATAGLALLMTAVAVLAATRVWPAAWPRFWHAVGRDLRDGLRGPWPWVVLPAAVVLGMGIGVRSMTLLAAALVVFYALARAGPRIVHLLALYAALAAAVAYVLWPQLWGAPFETLMGSLDRTVQFPQPHRTLFEGIILLSNDMPRTYLPHVLAIQLTLPALAVILPGAVLLVRSALRPNPLAALAWVLGLWFLIPFLGVVLLRAPIYNYFRHVLFILPPLFVAAAIALQRAVDLLRRPRWIGPILAVLLLLPGLAAIARLHPYEYGYFNELVGGVRAVGGRFIPDYWCTSLREAMRYVNEHAPASAGIAVTGPEASARAFAREDLRIRDDAEILTSPDFQPWAIVGCNLSLVNPDFFPDAPVLFIVEREGVPLTVVKLLATPLPSTSP